MSISPLAGKRALIVEAESLTALMLRKAVSRAGAQPLLYEPQESLSPIIEREKPDFMLVGVTPHNASNILEMTRKILEGTPICIIVMIDFPDSTIEHQLTASGVATIIPKPFTSGELVPLLEETYRRHCSDRSNEETRL